MMGLDLPSGGSGDSEQGVKGGGGDKGGNTQQPQDADPMLIQCWASVVDGGPTLDQHRANVLCLLGGVKGGGGDKGENT